MKENRRRKKSLFPSLQLVFSLSYLPAKSEGAGVTPRDAVSLWTPQNFQTQSEKSTESASSPRGAAGSACRLHRESLSPTFCLITEPQRNRFSQKLHLSFSCMTEDNKFLEKLIAVLTACFSSFFFSVGMRKWELRKQSQGRRP